MMLLKQGDKIETKEFSATLTYHQVVPLFICQYSFPCILTYNIFENVTLQERD